jgi:hypothetical protein
MSKRNSDWYIPPVCIWEFTLIFIVVLASILLPLLAVLKAADMRALYGFGAGAG